MVDQMAMGSPKRSIAAIVGLVMGIVALVMSWMPIINNFAFVIALVGIVFALVGLVGALRGKRAGKGLAIASVAVNVVALAVVLGTQSMYSAAIDDAVNGPGVTSTQDQGADQAAGDDAGADPAAQDEPATTDLAVGTAVTLENDVVVSVDEVATGLTNYDGSAIVGIRVTYTNNGASDVDYNPLDWKGADAQGAAEFYTYYSEGADQLDYGTLAAGGTVTGWLYFEGDTVEALYYASLIADAPTASWTLA